MIAIPINTKTIIDLSLVGHLPSQMEGLFENKNKKRKGEEAIPEREDG